MVSGSWPLSLIASARTGRDRRIARQTPFGPRSVIDGGIGPAEEMETESQRAGSDTRAAAGDDRLATLQPGRREPRGKRLGGEQRARLPVGQLVEGQVEAAGDMARAQARPRLLGAALETGAGPRVDHLLALCREIAEHLLLVAHQERVEPRGEMALAQRRNIIGDPAPLGLPFRQTAVEDGDVLVAEDAQHPPRAPSRAQARAVVDDDLVA